ncbi:MAG: hypothetical protein KatS3mg083_072 [Candidatus Dojkabacteria bacterium]|nr:MAG: hypothetical protein KatS3mg083_072 [Candidatus Dojkabacteria bacterium]
MARVTLNPAVDLGLTDENYSVTNPDLHALKDLDLGVNSNNNNNYNLNDLNGKNFGVAGTPWSNVTGVPVPPNVMGSLSDQQGPVTYNNAQHNELRTSVVFVVSLIAFLITLGVFVFFLLQYFGVF